MAAGYSRHSRKTRYSRKQQAAESKCSLLETPLVQSRKTIFLAPAAHTLGISEVVSSVRRIFQCDRIQYRLFALRILPGWYSSSLEPAWIDFSLDRHFRCRDDSRVLARPDLLPLWRKGEGSRLHADLLSAGVLLRRKRFAD